MGSDQELCFICGNPTGKAGRGDDSIYWADSGPWCESCSDTLRAEIEEDTERIANLERHLSDARREITETQAAYVHSLDKIDTLEAQVSALEADRRRLLAHWIAATCTCWISGMASDKTEVKNHLPNCRFRVEAEDDAAMREEKPDARP